MTAPTFVEISPATIETETVTRAETELQRDRIYDGEPIRLFLAVMAYRESLIRAAIQKAGEQNLVEFATGEFLDYRGSSLDAPRLTAAAAVTTLQFNKDADAVGLVAFIPQGTRVRTSDGLLEFATDSNLTMDGGIANATVQATASTVGVAGNGYVAGEVSIIVDPAVYIASAANTTTTNGGADTETDEAYRTRLLLAPSKFSVAGPSAAYEFWARSADSDVIDVAVVGPPTTARVHVNVYILATGPALPSSELITTVDTALQDDQVRPLTDIVTVLSPAEVNYTIDASVTALVDVDTASLLTQLQAAADAYAADRRSGMGKDIVRNQIIAALGSIAGVYDVSLTQPESDTVISASQWANATSVMVAISGTNEG